MSPADALLPMVEREQIVGQLGKRYRVPPERAEDFRQELHLAIAACVSRALARPGKPGGMRTALDVSAVRGYVYFVAARTMGKWLMREAAPMLSGGRNGDRRKKILAETSTLSDSGRVRGEFEPARGACESRSVFDQVPTDPEASPEARVGRREVQTRARRALRRLARRTRLGDTLGKLLELEGRRAYGETAKERRRMRRLRREILADRELSRLARLL